MQATQEFQTSSGVHNFYHQPVQQIDPYRFSNFQGSNDSTHGRSKGTQLPFQTYTQFHTLDSTPATDYAVYNSPLAVSISSNRSPFSPQCSHSYTSDFHHSSDNTYGSPLSGSSLVDDENKLMHTLWALKNELLGPECDIDYSGSLNGLVMQTSSFTKYDKILEMAPRMDLKQLLIACAETVSEADTLSLSERKVAITASEALMDMLEKRVSVSGEPLQRLSAYLLEGLRARLLSSGSIIYKKLKCNEPKGSELMSYMHVLYQICPYYKFAYISANAVIGEAMENENRIHIIDFQIAQGSQWVSFIQALSRRPRGPPHIRITGVDDSESAYARGGGLQLVGERLARVAESCGVPFEFHGAAMSGCEVQLESLQVQHGEALAVNFPYILHHMPDESVSTTNHRDRLLRLVKSLSPKVVMLTQRVKGRQTAINAEEHCVAKDVVNIIACEGNDRVERHELFGKWRLRLSMAGFSPIPLSSSVSNSVRGMLKEYSSNYRLAEGNGALYLGWKNRALVTSSAWR
ncbi:hypothetical protein DH2020_033039 [Rehmannia glutinosa]|uniref:Scarecrow-like protein 13 n=1 Tax=Rehmannia glutinosa TaxID=99300 RepID=A0ABR0VF61_REHGL